VRRDHPMPLGWSSGGSPKEASVVTRAAPDTPWPIIGWIFESDGGQSSGWDTGSNFFCFC
jgi:hypothetical protein